MIQDYDDEVGQYYEPIIYQFKLTADVQVGDTTFSIASNEIDEILLDGDKYVRDHEFNVYRIVKIGEQVWMADDLRCTTYNESLSGTFNSISALLFTIFDLSFIFLFWNLPPASVQCNMADGAPEPLSAFNCIALGTQ